MKDCGEATFHDNPSRWINRIEEMTRMARDETMSKAEIKKMLAGYGDQARFLREARPLMFFNACHSIRAGFNPVGLGIWAKTFLGEGASAFIGSCWKVVDDSALEFAQKFYSELFSGTPVGEALRLARLAIKDSGDPTWLAYSLYAHPEARRRYS
jgi:hypothetical protein